MASKPPISGLRLVAYTRVSTTEQVDNGAGLDIQHDAIAAWARANGHKITAWHSDEGISGSNGLDARQGLAQALAATRGCGGLVVYRLDRLARDMVLQEQLLRELWSRGAQVFSTSPSESQYLHPDDQTDPSRALIRRILGAVSEYERAMIRLRLNAGKARKRASGGHTDGYAPYGWRLEDRQLVKVDDQQQVLARIRRLRQRGESLRSIAGELNRDGILSPRGRSWSGETVRQILARPSVQARRPARA